MTVNGGGKSGVSRHYSHIHLFTSHNNINCPFPITITHRKNHLLTLTLQASASGDTREEVLQFDHEDRHSIVFLESTTA